MSSGVILYYFVWFNVYMVVFKIQYNQLVIVISQVVFVLINQVDDLVVDFDLIFAMVAIGEGCSSNCSSSLTFAELLVIV